MIERIYSAEDTIGAIRSMNERLPDYHRTTPADWSRTVQAAAFGKDLELVTEYEYTEIIDKVRKIRAWLKDFGKDAKSHPDYCHTDNQIFWLEDEPDCATPGYSISVEPRPWDKQLAVNLEPYPKFTVEAPRGDYRIHFNLNFDDSYCLLVANGHLPTFGIDALPRREMTRREYALVSDVISDAVSHFGVDLSYAEEEKGRS